jgi:hypothetical protein
MYLQRKSFKLKRECPPYRESLDNLQKFAEEMKTAAEKPETETIRTEIEECVHENTITTPATLSVD